MNKTYTVPKKGIEGLIAVSVLVMILLAFASPPIWVVCAAIVIGCIVIAVVLRKDYTYSITINAESSSITVITKSRVGTETDQFGFDEIHFVYKKRLDYFSFTNGYLKEKRNILLIDSKQKTLAFLVPGQDGWTNEIILDMAKTFAELGMKQIVDKYNDDEIQL